MSDRLTFNTAILDKRNVQWNVSFTLLDLYFTQFYTLLYGPSQVHTRKILNFNWLYVFPEFSLHFKGSDYRNIAKFTLCSSVLRIYYLRQQIPCQQSGMAVSNSTFNRLMHSCIHRTRFAQHHINSLQLSSCCVILSVSSLVKIGWKPIQRTQHNRVTAWSGPAVFAHSSVPVMSHSTQPNSQVLPNLPSAFFKPLIFLT